MLISLSTFPPFFSYLRYWFFIYLTLKQAPTEIWMYNLSTWTRSLLLITEHCFIVSASLSSDFSTLLYTTVGRPINNELSPTLEHYETLLVDLRIPRGSPRYLISSGKDYHHATVCLPSTFKHCLFVFSSFQISPLIVSILFFLWKRAHSATTRIDESSLKRASASNNRSASLRSPSLCSEWMILCGCTLTKIESFVLSAEFVSLFSFLYNARLSLVIYSFF